MERKDGGQNEGRKFCPEIAAFSTTSLVPASIFEEILDPSRGDYFTPEIGTYSTRDDVGAGEDGLPASESITAGVEGESSSITSESDAGYL